jgi:hypothetical protein
MSMRTDDEHAAPETTLALGQGLYYFVTGVWPLVSMRTFEAVTGPKVDKWLVKTVGVLVSVIGAVLWLAGRRRHVGPEPALLAVGSAAGLAAIDTVYSVRGRISKVYLLDAVVEVALVAAWVSARGARRGTRRSTSTRRRRAA